MELTLLSEMSGPRSICVVIVNQYKGDDFMKTNSRKEQEKLAVLLEISDTPKKNSDIIKGAESRMIITEELARVLSDKKTTVLKKELQFVLYFLKKDELVDVENRGYYTANNKTAEELIKTARIVDEALKADEKAPCILTPEALDEMGVILSAQPILVIPSEVPSGFEIIGSEINSKEETPASAQQVDEVEKPDKKGKKKVKKKGNPVKTDTDSKNAVDTEESISSTDENDKNDIF